MMAPNKPESTQIERVSNECAQCGSPVIAPTWSEHLSEHRVRHLWNCDACGYSYETVVFLAVRARAA
jgi:ribosomal protein S27AE